MGRPVRSPSFAKSNGDLSEGMRGIGIWSFDIRKNRKVSFSNWSTNLGQIPDSTAPASSCTRVAARHLQIQDIDSRHSKWNYFSRNSFSHLFILSYCLGLQLILKVLWMFSDSSTGHWANTVLPKQAMVGLWNSRTTLHKTFGTSCRPRRLLHLSSML